MELIRDVRFGEERALYGRRELELLHCSFDGPEDGESALKEAGDIAARHCFFNLRYPLWHDDNVLLEDCEMTSLCRAALWYTRDTEIRSTRMHGIKALRECREVRIIDSDILSPEFGWSTVGLTMDNVTAEGEYFLLRAEKLHLNKLRMKGKYSFQYVKEGELDNCVLDTKDAFWHSENLTVRNSVLKGEYLAWYAKNLTLINCTITGTQPLCYCENLRLIDCSLTEADLCFEKSSVEARLTSPVVSIKNPLSGRILVPSLGQLIMDEDWAKGKVVCTRGE